MLHVIPRNCLVHVMPCRITLLFARVVGAQQIQMAALVSGSCFLAVLTDGAIWRAAAQSMLGQ